MIIAQILRKLGDFFKNVKFMVTYLNPIFTKMYMTFLIFNEIACLNN